MSAPVLKYTLVRQHPDTQVSTALLAGQTVPEWAADLVQPDDYVGGLPSESGGDPSGSDSESTYGSWTVKELKAEIKSRNENRDADHVPADGNKDALVAALDADDEAQAESGDDEPGGDPSGSE